MFDDNSRCAMLPPTLPDFEAAGLLLFLTAPYGRAGQPQRHISRSPSLPYRRNITGDSPRAWLLLPEAPRAMPPPLPGPAAFLAAFTPLTNTIQDA